MIELPRPLLIAHRGFPGLRHEHTRSSYDLAIDEGTDYIEPDVVATKDGHLVVRHENQISGTTEKYSSAIPEPFTFIPEEQRSIALPRPARGRADKAFAR